jgi:hypothetical protein
MDYKIYDCNDFEGTEFEELQEQTENYSDVQLIRDDEFEEYATETAIDIDVIKTRYLPYFDTEKWANDLRMDYTNITIGDVDYLIVNGE